MTFITEEARNFELMDSEDKDFTKIFWRILNFLKGIITLSKSTSCSDVYYRSGTVNSNTVNSKFHLIRSFFEIFATFLLFHV